MKLGEIAEVVGGKLIGDPYYEVKGVGVPGKASEEDIVFCAKIEDTEKVPSESPVVVSGEVNRRNYIIVSDVKHALALFLSKFFKEKHPSGISDKAVIGQGAVIGGDVYVGPYVYVGEGVIIEKGVKIYPFTYVGEGTYIGENTVIFSGVHIYPRTIIGKDVRIHSGTVIGADGFGYHITDKGVIKLNHIGRVIIDDGVEIGANVCIDRALIDETRISEGTKIDNLVQIAHNCKIGKYNLIAGQTGFAGSVETGEGVMLGGQVGVADHVKIGDGVKVSAQSGVTKDLEPGKIYSSTISAEEIHKWRRIQAVIKRLPELWNRIITKKHS